MRRYSTETTKSRVINVSKDSSDQQLIASVNPHVSNALIALRDGTIIPENSEVKGLIGGNPLRVKPQTPSFTPVS